jgi:parallel beta-helix repeat protein
MPAAMALNSCPLAEIKNNSVKGMFYYAFSIYGCSDCVVSGNSAEKNAVGIYCVGTAMFKGNTFHEVSNGFVVTSMTGTIEDCVFSKTGIGIQVASATVQMTNCVYRDPPKEGFQAVYFSAGEVTLINCNFTPEQITLPKPVAKADKPMVTAMHYLILKVNGEVPEDTQVDVRTTNPMPPIAPGAADLNVRNVPAPLLGNRTPLPQSLSPVLVKAWVIDKDGKKTPPPEYTVRVLAPAEGDKERKILKTLNVKPEDKWFRPKPNDPAPTLEVSLK